MSALDDFRMQEQGVRHDNGAQQAHDQDDRAVRKGRDKPVLDGDAPIHRNQVKLVYERNADDGYEADDDRLDAPVAVV